MRPVGRNEPKSTHRRVASGSPDVGLRSGTVRRLQQTLSEEEHPLFFKCYTA